ncbi:hypothetical protein EYZ11_012523 [Aspergillus tanneri]|uniref:Hydrophobin n=1 Tax=Aspergillus tanneri TaxID=1220188 RepID=A0A4S3J0L6_9EURO|nr:uncharacterized protein ATNIH1004_007175 [Aspergillus tanneri]KAA8645756.1 hypothetical protein ATNIH1004_007175 [Aspergillus tanneri]THC88032.1 hypothetical protein EYZ11_012523 [Aspergillus tanneri]
MKFSLAAVVALAATVAALPSDDHNDKHHGGMTHDDKHHGGMSHGDKDHQVRFPVPDDMTVKEGSDKCGDQAQLSCCNKATYAGDTVDSDNGILAGLLSNLLGSGSGSEGAGIFEQCSKLPLQVNIIAIGLQDILNQQCKENIACCQSTGSDANGDLLGLALPCIALGSIL